MSRGSGGQPSHATPSAKPGSARRTASFVSQIATCLPAVTAAVATRNATVTRSASSRPVARLMSTFWLSAISLPFVKSSPLNEAAALASFGCPDRGSHRAELRGFAARVLEHRARVGVDQLALGDAGVRPLDQQARVLAMEQRPGNSASPQIDP